MKRILVPTMLAAVALAACRAQSPSFVDVRPAPPTSPANGAAPAPSATVQVADGSGDTGPLQLGALADLVVSTSYRGTPGPHAFRIDVQGPGGTLYTQLATTIVAGADGKGLTSQTMQVAGTPVEHYHMVGTWQFALAVDGAYLASASIDVMD